MDDDALKQWFKEEVEMLQRLANTQRLKGDYVAAQAMEREIRRLVFQTAVTAAGNGSSDGRVR